jgi:RHS repeat-associated protein
MYVAQSAGIKAGLGQTTAAHMSPYLAACAVAAEIRRSGTNTPKEVTTMALIARWAVDQLRTNGVGVVVGNRTFQFVKMPDGSYEPPAGIKASLAVVAGDFMLNERHGLSYKFDSSNGHRIKTITDPTGNVQTFSYSGGKLASVTDHFGRTLTFGYSGGDKITSVTDGTRTVGFAYTGETLTTATDVEGNPYTCEYDGENRITALFDPDNRVITRNTYDPEGRVATQKSMGDNNRLWHFLYSGYCNIEQDPLGGTKRYNYDERGRSVSTIDALGNLEGRAYDGQDRIVATTTPKFETTLYTYNSDHNPVTETDPQGEITRYFYDAQLRTQRINDKRGQDTTFTYTTAHLLQTVTDPLGNVTTYSYLPNGLPTTVKDGENKTTTTLYDAWGSPNKITAHDGTFQTFTNNARGDVLTSTDAENRTVTNTWNKRRQLLSTTAPAIPGQPAAVVTNAYDHSGNLASMTDANGNTTSYTWNAIGKPLATALPALPAGNNVVTTTYDTRDWIERTTNTLGHIMRREHDAAHRMTAVIDPLNRRSETTYDDNGRPLVSTDALNRTTSLEWTSRGEMNEDTDGAGAPTGYLYDESGNRTQVTNRRGKTYVQQYDGTNRLTSSTTPTGKTTSITHFSNHLIETIQEPSGQTTTFGYNGKNLVSTKSDPTGTITYGYDDSGLLETVTEGGDVITRTYDERGRLKTFTNADGDLIQYQYDANNNLTRITYPPDTAHPTGKQVNYTYNARNLLATVTDWNNRVTTYQYDRLGRLIGIVRPNGTSASISRDAADQLTSIRESSGSKMISYLRFDHDGAGQIERRFRAPLVQSSWQHSTFTATYDDDNRLATLNGQTVTHDADGNMTRSVGILPTNPTTAVDLAYNSRNQLTNADGLSYSYDAEGVRRTITDASGSIRDVIDPNGSLSRLLIRHNADTTKTYYVYGLGLLYEVDEEETTKTYHYDQVGSTILRTNDNGGVMGSAEYSAYGICYWKQGDMATPFLYNGQWGIQTDSNGLLNMRARYYSPYLIRFLNADPIGFSGGSNWFAYADGNPISKNDPFGLFGWRDALSIGVGFVPIIGTVQSAVELITGRDLITGESVNRGLAAAGLVAGLIPGGKGVLKGGSRLMRVGDVAGDTLRRPALWRETQEAIAEKAIRNSDGAFLDPGTGRLLDDGFHYGHKFGRENRRLVKEGELYGYNQRQFSEYINSNPQWFEVQGITENLSHAFEKAGSNLSWDRIIGHDALRGIGLGAGLNGTAKVANTLK